MCIDYANRESKAPIKVYKGGEQREVFDPTKGLYILKYYTSVDYGVNKLVSILYLEEHGNNVLVYTKHYYSGNINFEELPLLVDSILKKNKIPMINAKTYEVPESIVNRALYK